MLVYLRDKYFWTLNPHSIFICSFTSLLLLSALQASCDLIGRLHNVFYLHALESVFHVEYSKYTLIEFKCSSFFFTLWQLETLFVQTNTRDPVICFQSLHVSH